MEAESIEPEFECQICMDLLVEPSTTVCGHTFCKICLIRYLKTKLNCPICRKPILQSKESLAKNVMLENIIKAKYLIQYADRLKIVKLSYDEEAATGEDNKRNNIPALFLKETYVWPKLKKKLILTNMEYEDTISTSVIRDRLLVIIPMIPEINTIGTVSSLVEIISMNKRENLIEIEVVGLKRFNMHYFRWTVHEENTPKLLICSGEIIKDMEIDSEELLNEIKSKLKEIQRINEEILSNASFTFSNQIERLFGKAPHVNFSANLNVSAIEPHSFYFLNLLKNEDKKNFYITNNIYQRVNWLFEQYSSAYKHIGNQSLAINFYDLNISGLPKNQLKFTLILFTLIIVFGLAFKYKFIKL